VTQALIKAGLESTLKTWADAQTPAIPVAWENVAFTPPSDGARYVRFNLMPAQTHDLFIDGAGRDWKGVAQVSLCMPIAKGMGAALTLGAAIDAIITLQITYSTLVIHRTTPCTIGSGSIEDNRYVVPVWWNYKAVYA
jgi:hypothetical protein